jgi:hypothetical protein
MRGSALRSKKAFARSSSEGFRCKIAVLIPPLSSAIDLSLCAFDNADFHGLFSMTMSEVRKNLLGGDRLSAIRFGN